MKFESTELIRKTANVLFAVALVVAAVGALLVFTGVADTNPVWTNIYLGSGCIVAGVLFFVLYVVLVALEKITAASEVYLYNINKNND